MDPSQMGAPTIALLSVAAAGVALTCLNSVFRACQRAQRQTMDDGECSVQLLAHHRAAARRDASRRPGLPSLLNVN